MNDLSKCSVEWYLSNYAIIMHDYNKWNDAISEALINPLFKYGINTNAMFYAMQSHLNWWSMHRVNFNIFNMSCHHYFLRIDAMLECHFFFRCVSASSVGSGVDMSNDIEWAISRTNTFPSAYYSRRSTLDIYFIWLSTNKASSPPLWTYGFKVFQNLLFCNIRFNCLLSIDRIILSNACFILVA
jgi:hypothetical protein